MTWDYDGANIIYLLGKEERKYHVGYSSITRRLVIQGDLHDLLFQN